MAANLSGGTNLAVPTLLNVFSNGSSSNPRHTGATIYNRNMYLTYGRSNTTVDGNITSRGASGGVQLRMGGRMVDNLTLAEPVGLSVGHAENPAGVPYWAYIADNVVLGAMNISAQPRGFGIGFGGQGYIVERNIIAHNEEGTGSVEGLFCDTDSSTANVRYTHGVVRDNIVYNWKSPTGGGAALSLRHAAFEDTILSDNHFIQPYGGSIIRYSYDAALVGFGYEDNTVYAAGNAATSSLFSISVNPSVAGQSYTLPQFQSLVGGNFIWTNPTFADPERTISTYVSDYNLGSVPSVDGFMEIALLQSKFYWRPELSAYQVGEYIREGFELSQ
jgi:hypothetical protein